MVPLVAALLWSAPADAGIFNEKTMHGDFPERMVRRELVLPRGWFELGLGVHSKSSAGVRSTFGIVDPYNGAIFRHSTLTVSLAQGFTDRATLYVEMPWVQNALTNDLGADISTTAVGDSHAGMVYQPWLGTNPALAFRVDIKSPSGMEWPANSTGGGAYTEGFLTGTGTTNAGLFAESRYRIGDAAAIDLRLGFVYKFASVVGYLVQSGGFGNGWLKPGNELSADLSGVIQLGDPLSIRIGGAFDYRGGYFYGTSGPGTAKLSTFWLGAEVPYEFSGGEQATVETSPSGAFLDAGLSLDYAPTARMQVSLDASLNVLGADGRFFSHLGLEEFSPHPGATLGASGKVRW